MTQDQVHDFYKSKGYASKSNSPHLYKSKGDTDFRIVITTHSARKEVKHVFTPAGGRTEVRWIRLRSGYLKDLHLTDNGNLIKGMSLQGC